MRFLFDFCFAVCELLYTTKLTGMLTVFYDSGDDHLPTLQTALILHFFCCRFSYQIALDTATEPFSLHLSRSGKMNEYSPARGVVTVFLH